MNIVVVLTISGLLSACTTAPPNYRNPSPASDDARIGFESDYELHTHFSTSLDAGAEGCGKFETVGYLLKVDSIFLYDRSNHAISIDVPSRRIVGVAGHHSFRDPARRTSCYPKPLFFTPEPHGVYRVRMNSINYPRELPGNIVGLCYLSVEEIRQDRSSTRVAAQTRPSCGKR